MSKRSWLCRGLKKTKSKRAISSTREKSFHLVTTRFYQLRNKELFTLSALYFYSASYAVRPF